MTLRPNTSPCTIGDVCDFESGNGFRPQDWKTKGLPIIRIQNLNGSDSFNYFDGEPDPAWIVETNDLLFAWAGVKGVSFGPTMWNGPKGVLNQHIYRIRPKKGINKRWLYYALLEVTAEIESKAHGFKTSLVHVRKADITRARISLPGEHEQDAVATALGCWDTAIQKTEQLIAAKERHYSHELSRLISRGQHPHTHVGAFAEEVSARNRGGKWRTVALSDVATVWKGQQLNKDAMVEDGAYYALNGGIKPSGCTTEWNCEAGTITVSSGGNSCGFIRFNTERFWCGGDCFALKKLSLDVDALYLFHYLKGQQHRMMALRTGSGIPHVYRADVEAFPVALPDIETQAAIARYLNALREEIDLLGQSVAALKTQKRGLMQKLLTGQWRLPVQEEAN
jgi:type I restriction enzyme S subunit